MQHIDSFHPRNFTESTFVLLCLGIQQRIPSPRELQFHTQTIMQNALIKKKLEDQRENYRKRQEGQPPNLPMNNKGNVFSYLYITRQILANR